MLQAKKRLILLSLVLLTVLVGGFFVVHAVQAQDFGLTQNQLSFTISKETSQGDINWNATPSQSWITCTPVSGLK